MFVYSMFIYFLIPTPSFFSNLEEKEEEEEQRLVHLSVKEGAAFVKMIFKPPPPCFTAVIPRVDIDVFLLRAALEVLRLPCLSFRCSLSGIPLLTLWTFR